jgi:ribonuclease HI
MTEKICKHCGGSLVVKQTRRTPQQLLKAYYYTAYYICSRCGRIYHSDIFKVINEKHNLFNEDIEKGEPVDIEIWTDGACTNNGKENAKAAWAFVSGDVEKAGKVTGKQTNNRAEAEAIYEALLWAAEKKYKRIKIYTDSQITIYNMRKPIEKILINTDIFEKMFTLIEKHTLKIIFEKVLGHSGIIENERVDKLANSLVSEKTRDKDFVI